MDREKISSLAWLALAAYICVETIRRLPLGSWHDPGAGFWPVGAGLVLGGLSTLNLVGAFRKKSEEQKAPPKGKKRWKNLVFVLVTLLVYAASVETVGFLMGTFVLLVVLFRAVEPQRWIVAIGGSALISFATYMIFEIWLRSQLPRGIWGF